MKTYVEERNVSPKKFLLGLSFGLRTMINRYKPNLGELG